MEKCQIKVSSNYSATFNNKSMGVKLAGGLSKVRATTFKKADIVSVNWKTNDCGYGYLVAFYFVCLGKSFLIDLVAADGSIATKTCKFVHPSFKFSAQNTSNFSVSASVEIVE